MLSNMPPGYWRRAAPKANRMCYRRKVDAANKFLEANTELTEHYSGAGHQESAAEFDSVNHRYSMGKRKVRSIAEAVWVTLPPHRPGRYDRFCLEDIDIETLNETSPPRDKGVDFRQPDYVIEKRLAEEQAARESEVVPF
jgi:hypothetical protein